MNREPHSQQPSSQPSSQHYRRTLDGCFVADDATRFKLVDFLLLDSIPEESRIDPNQGNDSINVSSRCNFETFPGQIKYVTNSNLNREHFFEPVFPSGSLSTSKLFVDPNFGVSVERTLRVLPEACGSQQSFDEQHHRTDMLSFASDKVRRRDFSS